MKKVDIIKDESYMVLSGLAFRFLDLKAIQDWIRNNIDLIEDDWLSNNRGGSFKDK